VFSWITLFFIPILIFTGLFTLCQGLHWLITNQIPYESLEVDLHKFISSSSSSSSSSSYVLGLTLNFNKIKNYKNNRRI
jgi:hypothetical protein